MISIIAAIGKNREIGKKNGLLWHIPEELRHFKQITMGHPVIMGRKTYESIGRPLPGRINIVISQSITPGVIRGVMTVKSLESAIELAKKQPGADGIFIIGGASVFEQALPLTDKLYLTMVEAEFPDADAFFPNYSDFKKIITQKQEQAGEYLLNYLELTR